MGQAQPPKDSISADAQRLATANEQGTTPRQSGNGPLDPAEQSQITKESNFQQAVDEVGQKMAKEPNSVTKEDASLLHSREQRAHGTTEKGGIAAQAHSLATDNEKKGTA